MDALYAFFNWYEVYAFLFMPLLLAIFVIGVSLGLFQMLGDKMYRLALLVPVTIILLVMSFFTGEYGAELFLNLASQMMMTMLAVLFVVMATNNQSWFATMLILALPAIGLQFLTPIDNIGSNIPSTMGTAVIGAYLVAYMLRQEWAWSPVMQERRLSAAMRKARQQQAEQDAAFGDYFMLISGHDEATIDQRIDFLKDHDMTIIREEETEYDDESENFYRLINVKIETVVKNQETVLLNNKEARIQILAYPDISKRIYKQLGEVLFAREQKRIEAPNDQMLHIEFKADAPQKMYSSVLEQKIYDLAREWQYGEDESLQQATDDLLKWAKSEGLVQK